MPAKTCHITFVFEETTVERLRELALAVTFASHHYAVIVHTNLVEEVSRIGLQCSIAALQYKRLRPWSLHKLNTYANAPLGETFIHIDSDVFLVDPLPESLLKAGLFAQSAETIRLYPGILADTVWAEKFLHNPFRAYNCGVLGGDPVKVREYAALAIGSVKASSRPMAPTWPEQAVLGCFEVGTLFDNDDLSGYPYQTGPAYIHLMESKRERDVELKVKERLAKENPVVYQKLERDTISGSAAIVTYRPRIGSGAIRDFYRTAKPKTRSERWVPLPLETVTLTISPVGLGDVVQLTDLCRSAHAVGKAGTVTSGSPHFETVMPFCPSYAFKRHGLRVCIVDALERWGLGGGHNFQRIQRLFQLPVTTVPKGHLMVPNVGKIRNRVSIHSTPGRHAGWQRERLHPRARTLYPDTMLAIEELANDPNMTFVEVGSVRTFNHRRVEDGTGDSIPNMIRLMAECEFHIGPCSGPMHIAAALGAKVITIINFPNPNVLMLPQLIDTGALEAEWFYPQSVILHQDTDSTHWPKFSGSTLRAAINGEVYPYWDNSILEELAP